MKIILRFKKHFDCRYKNNLELTASCRYITQCGCFEMVTVYLQIVRKDVSWFLWILSLGSQLLLGSPHFGCNLLQMGSALSLDEATSFCCPHRHRIGNECLLLLISGLPQCCQLPSQSMATMESILCVKFLSSQICISRETQVRW